MKKSTTNISTLVAVGGSLIALPAAALELGEAQINSSLGQPLRASIAYALAPNETLSSTCVSTQVGQPGSAAPKTGASKISVANGIISIIGTAAVREPIISMRVTIRCPYAAKLSREYTVFVDPAGIPAQVTIAQAAATTAIRTPVVAATPALAMGGEEDDERVYRDQAQLFDRLTSLKSLMDRLAAQVPWSLPTRLVCFWSRADVILLPATTARVDGAENHELEAVTHYGYLLRPSCWRRVQSVLSDVSVLALR